MCVRGQDEFKRRDVVKAQGRQPGLDGRPGRPLTTCPEADNHACRIPTQDGLVSQAQEKPS